MLPEFVRACRLFVITVVVVAGIAARPAFAQEASVEPGRQMPVRGGSITIKVADFAAAREKVLETAKSVGAEVTDGKTYVTEKGRKHGYVRLRFGAEHLAELLPAVRSVGTLAADDLSTQDQASTYEDLGRRVTRLRQHQQRLVGLLDSRRNLRGSDVLYIQERLFRAGVDEEQLLQQRNDMERQSRRASITVTLFEALPAPAVKTPIQKAQSSFGHWFANGMRRAKFHRDELLVKVATAGAYALVYAPIWLPLTLGGALLLRFLWRRRQAIVLFLKPYAEHGKQAMIALDKRLAARMAFPATATDTTGNTAQNASPVPPTSPDSPTREA